jgi:tripartite-type tricarboxylate transporter receptor subunit TctC
MAGKRLLGRRGFGLGIAGTVLAPPVAWPQGFPSRQVHVVVPYPAGGGTDIVARLIMSRLGERWKQTVIIENKAGASGIVGSEIVAKSPPDGYTLLVTTSAHTINPFTTRRLPYDTERDFTPITILVSGALALVGSVKAGFGSMEKFLAAARAQPGKYQFGSADNTTRMIGELFRVKSGLNIENVAYKGAAPMLQELAGGHIPVGFSSPLSSMAHHRAGTVRILAVTSEKRLALLPDVPTMAEAGVPGVDRPQWFSLFGPGNMPSGLARRVRDDVVAVLAEPSILARIEDLASEPGGQTPEDFAQRVRSDLAIWQEIAKVAGIEPD